MARLNSLPYLVPQEDRVASLGWVVEVGDESLPAPEFLSDWDPASKIEAGIEIEVDYGGIVEDCQISKESSFRIGSSWYSPGTGLRGHGTHIDSTNGEPTVHARLEVSVEGKVLSQTIVLASELILLEGRGQASALSPRDSGSRLWKAEQKIQLQGSAARFPMEIRDFRDDLLLPDGAVWFLSWDEGDLHQFVLGGMRLYINSAIDRVARAASIGIDDEPAIRDAIYYDVARSVISAALNNAEFRESPEVFGDESVGASLRRLLGLIFPEESLRSLYANMVERPDRFTCELQDRLHLFGGTK